jgi:hypothetical protein
MRVGALVRATLALLVVATVLSGTLAAVVYAYPLSLVRRAEARERAERRRLETLVNVTRDLTRLDRDVLLQAVGEAAATVFGGEAGFRLGHATTETSTIPPRHMTLTSR